MTVDSAVYKARMRAKKAAQSLRAESKVDMPKGGAARPGFGSSVSSVADDLNKFLGMKVSRASCALASTAPTP